MRDQLIRDIQAIEAKYKNQSEEKPVNESVNNWPGMASFDEYVKELASIHDTKPTEPTNSNG